MARLLLIACLFATLATLAIAHKRDPPTTTPKPAQPKQYAVQIYEPTCKGRPIKLNLICQPGRPDGNSTLHSFIRSEFHTGARETAKISVSEVVARLSAARG